MPRQARAAATCSAAFTTAPGALIKKYGMADAKTLGNLSLEGLALIVERIAKHDIKCDLKFGHVTAAMNDAEPRHLTQKENRWTGRRNWGMCT